VLHITCWGVWSFVWWAKSTKAPLWQRDCVAKLQLAFRCNWLWKIFRLCDMSSLQDMSSFQFVHMTGHKVAQRIQVVSTLLQDAKPVLGLLCLHLNTTGYQATIKLNIQHCSGYLQSGSKGWPMQVVAGLEICTMQINILLQPTTVTSIMSNPITTGHFGTLLHLCGLFYGPLFFMCFVLLPTSLVQHYPGCCLDS